jgi:negative regulator of flagellin synthesis FlgM
LKGLIVKISSAIPSIGGATDSSRPRPANGAAVRPAPSGDAQVELSSLSSQLQEIATSGSAASVVDSGRVAEIKQAISEGRFKIDPERIADGLVNSVRQMLAKNS